MAYCSTANHNKSLRRSLLPCQSFLGTSFIRDRYRAASGPDSRAELIGIDLRQLSSEKQNLRGVIDPDQNNYKRTCSTVGTADRRAAKVEAYSKLANRE